VYFLDEPEYSAHRALFPRAGVVMRVAVDMAGWRPQRELIIAGKRLLFRRTDLLGFQVWPMRCERPECSKVFVAYNDIINMAAVVHYETHIRPHHPERPPVLPVYGMVAHTPGDFAKEVAAIRNPLIRDAVLRRLNGAGWETLVKLVREAMPPQPPPFVATGQE
jgi:hypothetical protein